eukprot:TRINITY_DN12126_c0_g1_i1.p1 TRINITY_DN12126_c0_g1~~TRINITY_DN12126_c0_g1_i1.p1  ORF type:complete len:426 (+),score=48.10 TRINITY_DN12126_c0_g1_i1:51-1328(+)
MALPPPMLAMDDTPPCTPRVVGKGLPETPKKLEASSVVVPQRSESPELPTRVGRRVKTKLSLSTSISKGMGVGSVMFETPEASPLGESVELSQAGETPGWFATQFRLVTEIGKGNFGKVVEVVSTLEGMHYAVKILNTAIRSQHELSRKIEEAKVLARCDHPNILRYYNCWVEDKQLYIQCEYCPGGSLDHRMKILKDQKKQWPENIATALLLQMTAALDYLHNQVRVAHLDVKPENIYTTSDGRFKLGDFGHAYFLDQENRPSVPQIRCSLDSLASDADVRFSLEEGDIRYLPLEMLNDKSYLSEADIFSLGMSIYEVLTGIPPPNGAEAPWRYVRETSPLPETITTLNYSPKIALATITMLRKDPKSRPTTGDILAEFQDEYYELLTAPTKYLGKGSVFGGSGASRAQSSGVLGGAPGMAKAP